MPARPPPPRMAGFQGCRPSSPPSATRRRHQARPRPCRGQAASVAQPPPPHPPPVHPNSWATPPSTNFFSTTPTSAAGPRCRTMPAAATAAATPNSLGRRHSAWAIAAITRQASPALPREPVDRLLLPFLVPVTGARSPRPGSHSLRQALFGAPTATRGLPRQMPHISLASFGLHHILVLLLQGPPHPPRTQHHTWPSCARRNRDTLPAPAAGAPMTPC